MPAPRLFRETRGLTPHRDLDKNYSEKQNRHFEEFLNLKLALKLNLINDLGIKIKFKIRIKKEVTVIHNPPLNTYGTDALRSPDNIRVIRSIRGFSLLVLGKRRFI